MIGYNDYTDLTDGELKRFKKFEDKLSRRRAFSKQLDDQRNRCPNFGKGINISDNEVSFWNMLEQFNGEKLTVGELDLVLPANRSLVRQNRWEW